MSFTTKWRRLGRYFHRLCRAGDSADSLQRADEKAYKMGYSDVYGGLNMTRAAKDIVKAAIQLPENERVQVVEQLLASLEPESDEDVDSAWAAEIERRSRQIKEGTVSLIPWEEVKSQARKRARAKK